MTEKELKALLADMTLEEKVDQMNQVAAGMFSGDITAMGPNFIRRRCWTGLVPFSAAWERKR